MKLISMIEFVKKMNNSESKGINALIVEYGKIVDYAKFLEQPLRLEIFVPCKDGNVLSKPNYYESFLNKYYLDKPNLINYENCHAYKEAEDKVLFEGLSYKFGMIGYSNDKGWSSAFDLDFRPNSIIEDLLNDKKEYILSKSAIKKLGL